MDATAFSSDSSSTPHGAAAPATPASAPAPATLAPSPDPASPAVPQPEDSPRPDEPPELAALFASAANGDSQALEKLLPVFYDQLRAIAAARLRRTPPGGTLQATALVHEAYLRLAGRADQAWQGRGHFFFAASRAMRDVLVERARRRSSRRERETARALDATKLTDAVSAPDEELLALDAALGEMAAEDPRGHEVVMLRFFGGLGVAEVAELLGVSERTVKRDWRLARARLHAEVARRAASGEWSGVPPTADAAGPPEAPDG